MIADIICPKCKSGIWVMLRFHTNCTMFCCENCTEDGRALTFTREQAIIHTIKRVEEVVKIVESWIGQR